jgi:hypothetical protein
MPGAAAFTVKVQEQQSNVIIACVSGESPLGRAVAAGQPPSRNALAAAARAESLRGCWGFDAGVALERAFLAMQPRGAGLLREEVPAHALQNLCRETSAMDDGMFSTRT